MPADKSPLSTQEALDFLGIKISEIADDNLVLPVGISIGGKVVKSAKVRAVTGEDRKIAMGGKIRSAPIMMTTLLERCVVSLGGTKPNVTDIRRLSEADRNYLAVEIRRHTFPGEKMEVITECDTQNGGCGEKTSIFLDLEELEMIRVEPIWRDNVPCFEFSDDGMNLHVIMKYLTGQDAEEMSREFSNKKQNEMSPAEIMDAMVLKMVVDVNGKELSKEIYDKLPSAVHSTLEQAVNDHRAGPDLTPYSRCYACGKELNPVVNIVDFLLRGRQKKELNN